MSRTAREIRLVEAKDQKAVKRKETTDDKGVMELYRKERMEFLNMSKEVLK